MSPWIGLFFCAFAAASPAAPLHERIDELASASASAALPAAALCDDATFLRRASLDLIGMIPTSADARRFLDDPAADKRVKLIDALLADPRFATHMATVFDVMLMERRPAQHVKAAAWRDWLAASIRAGKPLDQLAREVLRAGGSGATEDGPPPAARFYLDRQADPHLLTRDVGRIFFGRDLLCAQCHDHPVIDDYVQADYHDLRSFFIRLSLYTDKKRKRTLLAEKAEGEASYQSVFRPSAGTFAAQPRLAGQAPIEEPVLPAAKRYRVPPKKGVRHVPTYSRLDALARHATDEDHRAFSGNLANRLWAHMVGRGLVEPVDMHHAGNPPSSPPLLEALADALVRNGYDLRELLRQIALSKTYQRSVAVSEGLLAVARASATRVTALEEEHRQLKEATETAYDAVVGRQEAMDDANKAAQPLARALESATKALAAANKAAAPVNKALADARAILAKTEPVAAALQAAADSAEAAARLLSDDKPVTEAAATFRDRAAKAASELKAARERVGTEQTKADPLLEKVAAAQQSVEAAQEKLAEARQQVRAAQCDHREALATYAVHRQAEALAAAAMRRRRTLAAYAEAVSVRDRAAQRAETLAATVAMLRARRKEARTQAAERVAALNTANLAKSEAAKTVAAAEQEVQRRGAVARSLADAAEKAALAVEKSQDDKELARATATLADRAAQEQKRLAEAETMLAEARDRDQAAADRVRRLEQQTAEAARDVAAIESRLGTATREHAEARAAVAPTAAAAEDALDRVTALPSGSIRVGLLDPLTPDQVAWSMLQATGVVTRQRVASRAELEKRATAEALKRAEALKKAGQTEEAAAVTPPPVTEAQVVEAVEAKLRGQLDTIVGLFAPAAGQPQDTFFATVDQALFLNNSPVVLGWLKPAPGNLVDRLMKMDDASALAEELYLSVLARRPTAQERAEVASLPGESKDSRLSAVQEMVWGLIASAEFRFNR